MYKVHVGHPVFQSLRRMPTKLQERLLRAAYRLEADARPKNSIKLSGQQELYRIRSGDYRIIYYVNDEHQLITITLIAHRRDVYRGL